MDFLFDETQKGTHFMVREVLIDLLFELFNTILIVDERDLFMISSKVLFSLEQSIKQNDF